MPFRAQDRSWYSTTSGMRRRVGLYGLLLTMFWCGSSTHCFNLHVFSFFEPTAQADTLAVHATYDVSCVYIFVHTLPAPLHSWNMLPNRPPKSHALHFLYRQASASTVLVHENFSAELLLRSKLPTVILLPWAPRNQIFQWNAMGRRNQNISLYQYVIKSFFTSEIVQSSKFTSLW